MRKFTLVFSMLFAFVLATVAQNPIAGVEDIKPGKVYWFQYGPWLEENGVQASIFWPNSDDTRYSERLWSAYVFSNITDDPSDTRQQFTLVECEGKLYLYNIAAQKYVSLKDEGAMMMDIPTSFIEIQPSTYGHASYPFVLAFDGTNAICNLPVDQFQSTGYVYCGWSVEESLPYSSCQVYEVGEYAAIDSLTEALAYNLVVGEQLRTEAMDSLSIVLEEVDLFLIEDAQYTANGGGEVELQAEDPAAGNYISSPQEHNINNASSDGGGMAALIDGDTGTFMHTSWGVALDAPHYIQIDLAEPLQKFSIAYHTRVFDGGNDFPDAIEVLGSNNGVDFTPITVLDKNLPQQPDKSWTSDDIVADQPYKHLRFNVTAERIYFHMSEFALFATADETADEKYLPYVSYIRELVALWNEANEMYSRGDDKADDIMAMITELNDLMELIKGLASDEDDPKTIEFIARVKEVYELQSVGCPTGAGRETFKAAIDAAEAKPTTKARLDLAEALEDYYKIEEVIMPTNGTKYTLTFITYTGRRNYLDYTVNEEEGTYALSMVQDTLTNQGLSYPETAVFTCEDNGDGTYSFVTYDGKYLGLPGSGAASGSQTGISESKVDLYLVKMYPNGKCETDVTWEDLFGLMAYHIGGVFPAPNSSGSTFYTGNLPHFMGSWTSAMAIEEYVPGEDTGIDAVAGETVVKGIYDLSGRRVENPAKGIYIINGKKVLVK
jgi:hypothetical protein